MPDHDLFDLEDAFSSLERDIATISSPRGAGHAVATSRRRRRTTYGAVAAVAVLAVGGVALGHGLGGHDGSVGPSEQPLPPPTPLSAGALSTATVGWVDGWGTPTDPQAKALADIPCLSKSATTPALDNPSRVGGDLYGADSSRVAYVLGMEFPADEIDAAASSLAAATAGCHPTASSTTTYTDGSTVSFFVLPATGDHPDVEMWTAQHGDRLGLAIVGGAGDAPSPDTVARVDGFLIGVLQVDATFRSDVTGGSITSGSSNASSSDFGMMTNQDFADALGTWPNDWRLRGSKDANVLLPCAGDWTTNSTNGAGAALGSNGVQDYNHFDSPQSAATAAETLAADLAGCATSPATVTHVTGDGSSPVTVAVGSGDDARVTWIVQQGPDVADITIHGDTAPPDQVSLAVQALVEDALKASTHGPPPVESSTPVQQQGGHDTTSSSSSSAAAPQ